MLFVLLLKEIQFSSSSFRFSFEITSVFFRNIHTVVFSHFCFLVIVVLFVLSVLFLVVENSFFDLFYSPSRSCIDAYTLSSILTCPLPLFFLTCIVCLYLLLDIRPCASSSALLSPDVFLSITKICPEYPTKGTAKVCILFDEIFYYRAWFREVFLSVWNTLFLLFLISACFFLFS